MREHAWLLPLGITAVLAAMFCLPGISERSAATPYSPMEGKTLSLADEPGKPAEAAPPAPATAPRPALAPPQVSQPSERRRTWKARRVRRAPQIPAKEPAVALPAVSTPTVAAATAAAAAPAPAYTFDAIAERYENDPSDFSLDRSARVGDMTLRLLGLERLAEAYVLKVDVANDSSSDFYVKGFVVQSGTKTLISRFFFRILVESQRARQGYVVFERPQTGAVVKIRIEEEGGKGRALSTAIPYPF